MHTIESPWSFHCLSLFGETAYEDDASLTPRLPMPMSNGRSAAT
jgi:hypothetical protein